MREIQAEPGMHIAQAARELIRVAKSEDVFLMFNDICITATKFSTAESICADYDRLSALRREEYEKSPKGIATRQRTERERADLQHRADELMTQLPNLNFNDVGYLLDWLCQMEDPRDRVGVTVDEAGIRETFQSHGYKPNANTGAAYDADDRENAARWIIGQAIAQTYVPLVQKFYEQWKEKF